ncbi:SDR family oxidoreductase [Novosphingobium taihuense]|uniref:NAD(P)-dependent dehydrogenase (Short-subunit alcohol dehydrogenase family) n=1 Tax=Novosphingobium taihuense TaxID=260085 RepID=A0A7W7ACV3_9SPHN|nr:SDR family oxidoreductase [Novosphingobium taihuense]MBB4613905.1 NAD(P)-dependent dehydrogenase (short-subunit alcohol dehydrogenase family) [Novosphingobium taihuense]TWH86756.1 NADP-dependent 3-hydroxy acid dehydrogenase YdfG [Novosphingobium taihuense]
MASLTGTNLSDAHTQQPALAGKRVVVTGGTTGIGRAIAVLLASEGAQVFVCGRDENHLADALARINEVGRGDGVAVDLATPEGMRRFWSAADAALGGALDVAIINAAVPAGTAMEVNEEELRYQLETDLVAYVIASREAARRMSGSSDTGGDIVLIGSMSAVSRGKGSSTYVAAKSGVQGFAAAFREEMAPKNIKVGLIEPGLTGADLQYPEHSAQDQRDMINDGQMLRAEDIATATYFMLTQPRRTAVSLIRVEPRLDQR